MGIKKSIIIVSAILISLFLLREIISWRGNSSVIIKTDNAYLFQAATKYLQGIFRGVNEFIIDEGEPLSVALINKNLKRFQETLYILKTELQDEELNKILIEKIEPEWQAVKIDVTDFLNIEYISADNDEAMLKYGKLATEANILIKDVELLAQKTQEIAKATSQRTKTITVIVAIVIFTILALLLLHLYLAISSPINDLNKIAEGFENGDLSLIMNESGKDEFGILASHFNKAIAKLSNMIAKVKDVAGTLIINAKKVAKSSMQISQNTLEQSNQTSQTAAAIEELSRSFTDVTKNTMSAVESSKSASEFAKTGGEVVEKTINGMNRISASVHDSSQIIEALGNRSEQIGEIIKVINDIAGQTNLLALNAAIEAARAGEQGRGFSVVADEVRKLAERTTTATGDIGVMITGIQDDTRKAIESMHKGTTEVQKGVELANQAGDALKQIVESVENVKSMIEQIAAASEEQTTTGDEISATTELVAKLTKDTADNAKHSSDATQHLTELARQLHNLVNVFILSNDINTIDSGHQGTENKTEIKNQPVPLV